VKSTHSLNFADFTLRPLGFSEINLLVWRIGFGVTGLELVGVMPMVQGFVRCDGGSLWLVIIPKSKDRFMERPPMKIVQP
jgi:hypothetical protein